MHRKAVLCLLLILSIVGYRGLAEAQDGFGKNRVAYREFEWKIYYSPHFAIRYYGDLSDPNQYRNMQKLVALLENHFSRYSSAQYFNMDLKERLNVIIFETHSDLESHPLGEVFLPEGVGAFVEWVRIRMVLKADFEPQLYERVIVHELAHQFQMKKMKIGSVGGIIRMIQIPSGFIEGGAEYLTGVVLPHTRDDIRNQQMRMMGSDIHLMPSWEELMADRVSGYVAWKMVFDFLDAKFGPGTGIKLHMQGINGNGRLGQLLYRLGRGVLGNPDLDSELFNQEFFNYYNDLYEHDRASRPKPYQQSGNFKGRNITPTNHPYPFFSPALSPDGKRIAGFTVQKNGIALVSFPIIESVLYSEPINVNQKDIKFDEKIAGRPRAENVIRNLTRQMPPIPYESLMSPFDSWPKNGSHVAWSRDGRIAFFARTGRDHVLYIIEDKEGDNILQKIVLSVDQGFSPSFSPDGAKVYFSASLHSVFDIYIVDLKTGQVSNLTNDIRHDTAPVVSPDGSKLVYVGNDEDFSHLFMLDLEDLSKQQITFNRNNDISPSWSDDGKKLIFSSDRKDKIFGVYTLDLEANSISEWIVPFGGIETPIFARDSDSKIYYVVYRNDDTFHGMVYENYEVFEAELIKPVSTELEVNLRESNIYSFDSSRFFELQLDPNQVSKPKKAPEDWLFSASDVVFGGNTYYGIFGGSSILLENMMKTKIHSGQYFRYGSNFQIINYTYLNQEKRLNKGFVVNSMRLPLAYSFYSISEGRPESQIINATYFQELSFTLFGQYPRSKWTRFEFFSSLKDMDFDLGGLTPELFEYFGVPLSENDLQVFRLMSESNGSSLESGVAFVRDTVVSSAQAQGFLHGNAFRFEFKGAPPLGGRFNGYYTTSADFRTYRKLSPGTLFALRGEARTSTRKSGEILVLGGPEKFRGREWGSIMGNQLIYGSAELRFPLVDGIVFPGGFGIGPFRGFVFVDAGISKFTGEEFLAKKIAIPGAGIEIKPFQMTWARQPNGKFVSNFYITYGW